MSDSNGMVEHEDGSVTLRGSTPSEGDWHVHEEDGVWVADHPRRGRLRTERSGPLAARFRDRGEAIAALIGDPQATA
jgi:hypothetical protein